MNKRSLQEQLEHEEEQYAQKMIAEGKVWEEKVNLYAKIAENLDMVYPPEETIAHVDLGTGPGNLPIAMAQRFLQSDRHDFLIVGVDVNPILAQHAAEHAHAVEGLNVSTHLQWKRENVKGKLKKIFYADEKSLDSVDLTPDGRIVIILDDMRWNAAKVLPAILERCSQQTPISTMSHTLTGAGGDMALETSKKALTMDYGMAVQELHRISKDTRMSVHKYAAHYLQEGGYLYMAQRALAGLPKEAYKVAGEAYIPSAHKEHLAMVDAGPIMRTIEHIRRESELNWETPEQMFKGLPHTLVAFILQRTDVPISLY